MDRGSRADLADKAREKTQADQEGDRELGEESRHVGRKQNGVLAW